MSNVELATAYISLIPSLKGAADQIKEGLGPAAEEAGAAGGMSLGGAIMGGISKFAAPIAALAAGWGIHKEIEKSTEAFEGLASTTVRLQAVAGGSMEQVSGLAGAMTMFGMNADDSQRTLGIFSKNLGNATKDGATTQAMIQKLGFDFRDAHGQVLPLSDLMPKLADKFASMPDGAEKTAIAMQLLGRSGAQMIPMLDQGSAGFAQLTQKAKDAGLVLDDTSKNIFMQGKLSAAAYHGAIQGLQVSLGQDLAPVMESVHNIGRNMMIPVMNTISKILQDAREPALKLAEGIEKFAVAGGEHMKRFMADLAPVGAAIHSFFQGITEGASDNAFARFGAAASEAFHVVGEVVKNVTGALSNMFKGINFGEFIPQVIGVAQAFSPVHLAFEAIKPVLPVLISAFSQLAKVVGGALMSTFETIAPIIMNLAHTLVTQLSGALVQILPLVVSLLGTLGQSLAQIIPVVGQIIQAIAPLIAQLIAQLVPIFIQIVSTVLPPVIQILGQLIQAIAPLVTMIVGLLIPVIQALLPVITTVFSAVASIITAAMQIVMGIIQVVTGIISGNWDQVWQGIQNIFAGIWNTIVAILSGAINIIASVISAELSIISGIWNAVWGGISSFFAGIWSGLLASAANGLNQIISFFQGLPGQIIGVFAGAGSWLINVGSQLVGGLISGIQAMAGAIVTALVNLLPGPLRDMAHSLGIASPSRVVADLIGKPMGQGVIMGVEGEVDNISAALQNIVKIPSTLGTGISGNRPDVRTGTGGGGQNVTNYITTNDPEGAAVAVTRRLAHAAI